MQDGQVDAYLARIGAPAAGAADLRVLAALQQAHLRAVPFENLSIHLGEPIVLDEDQLWTKIVERRRGGFCYELNGAFGALLRALGFRVAVLAARVYSGERFGPPLDHLALRVDLAESWLVDVGFGAFSTHPLRLADRDEQPDPAGRFQVRAAVTGELTVTMDGAPQYRLEERPYQLADFVPTCWWQQTSPDSSFTRRLICSRPTGDGRITLSGQRLIVTGPDGKQERELTRPELLPAYADHFGIVLDRLPTVLHGAADPPP
jgi:N-hydroxyarylamine O-acetyltransferase